MNNITNIFVVLDLIVLQNANRFRIRGTFLPLNETRAEATLLLVNASFMFRDGFRRLISSDSISSVSVLKRYFFYNVKFCSAGIVSMQALH